MSVSIASFVRRLYYAMYEEAMSEETIVTLATRRSSYDGSTLNELCRTAGGTYD